MFALGNATFACGVCSARERSFEEASGETVVGRCSLSPPLAPEPRPLPLQTHPAGTQTEPQLEAVTSAFVILPETGQFLLLCSLQLWQQLQRCCQTRARVQVFKTHFTSVLQKLFATNDTFLMEVNGYKRALVSRNAWLYYMCTKHFMVLQKSK